MITHKFILEYAERLGQPIDLRPEAHKYIRHCRLTLVDDGKICTTLSDAYYVEYFGARSLEEAPNHIRQLLTDKYSNTDELVKEYFNDLPLQEFVVRRVPIGDGMYDIDVSPAMAQQRDITREEDRMDVN